MSERPDRLHAEDAPTLGGDAAVTAPVADDFGQRYRTLERIGMGGFGDVFLAEQLEPVRRKVAIKVIKLGMDTREVIARFEAERQALAMMDHPSIARVYDAGATTAGRPFFVMELVKGLPLTQYCDERRMSVRDRIALFIDVCAAVQHAHQKGVIHRDLKPTNVLVAEVDGKATPKVIDFGIAKATAGSLTERTMHTMRDEFIGTPQYMAPEQAEAGALDIDTRADIYSLGAMLYELLTGVTPVDTKTLHSVNRSALPRLIATHEAPRASTRVASLGVDVEEIAQKRRDSVGRLRRSLRGEVDWILMKALERDRRRRYDTANALAMDLQRHLDDEPVLASPPSARYLASKFVRRHKAAVAVAVTIAVAVVGSGAFAAASYFEVRRERDASERARAEAEAVTAFLVESLAAASPKSLGREVTVREVMDQAAARVSQSFAGRPGVESRLRDAIGRTYLGLGEFQAASPQLDRALELRLAAFGENDSRTIASMNGRAESLFGLGRYDEATALHEDAVARAREILGDTHHDTIVLMVSLASVHAAAGRLDEAEALLLEALAAHEASQAPVSTESLAAQNTLALIKAERTEFEDAERLMRAVIAGTQELRGEEYPDALESQANLVWLLTQAGRFDEAIAVGEETLPVTRRIFGEEHMKTLTMENNLAVAYRKSGRNDDARPLLEHDLAVSRRVLGDRHPDTLVSITNMGRFMLETGRLAEAERLYAEAVATTREVMGPDFIGVGISQLGHGRALAALGRHQEAEAALLDSHRILVELFGPDDAGVQMAAKSLGEVYAAIGRDEEAATWTARGGGVEAN